MPNYTGTSGNDSISGTSGDDTINGEGGNDRLIGGGGNDIINGGDGADYITGSNGDDVIDGGAGNDRAGYYQVDPALGGATVSLLVSGPQNTGSQGMDTLTGIENLSGTPFADILTGDNNDNWLWGAPATLTGGVISATNNDTLDGQGGNDLLTVGIGNHTLIGGSGVDTVRFTENGGTEAGITIAIYLGAPQDTGAGMWTLTGIENLSGGIGNDLFEGNNVANVLAGDLGNDQLFGGGGDDLLLGDGSINVDANGVITTFLDSGTAGGNDSLYGGGGNDTLHGGAGLDSLYGGSGNDSLYGGIGNDFLNGSVGDDLVDGGAGYDRAGNYHTNAALGGVTIDLNIVGPQNTGSQGTDTLTGIENVSGTPFADILTGDDNDNWLWGSGAWNGATLTSSTNDDTLNGGGGNDLLTVGQGNHNLTGGAGIDTVTFTENTTLVTGLTLSLALQGAQATGYGNWLLSGFENLSGSVADDTLTGDNGVNVLAGNTGNDTLSGADGDDTLYGDGQIGIDFQGLGGSGPITTFTDLSLLGAVGGNDVLDGGLGNDTLHGGGGSDTATYASASGSVQVDLGLGTATGAAGNDTLVSIENVTGSAFDDTLVGDAVANRLDGGLGNDTLNGDDGNDTLNGDDGNDVLYGGRGDDFISGGSGDDRLNGGLGNDTVDGGAGKDIVTFSGLHSDYLASAGAGGAVVISGADSGDDTYQNVEVYRFADGDYGWDSASSSLVFIKSLADGYIAGATVFIDIDRDGTFDSGVEPFTISDANGNFLLADTAQGPLLAIGGTNIDTGLANLLTLSAPEGSNVINPLTTLVEALVASGLTEAAAEAQVLSALGLDPSLDLTTFDILAAPAGDAAALAAQKAAASIAEILSTIVEAAGATGGTAAQAAGVASLVSAVSAAALSVANGGAPLALTDNALLTDVLSDALPSLSMSAIAELAAATEAANIAIDLAPDLGAVSNAQGNSAPTIPAIDAGQTNEDAAVMTINLLGGAQDADGDTLAVTTIVSAVTGANAVVTTSLIDNILSINPAQFNALAAGESRTITVTYRVSDGNGGLTTNIAILVVNGVNDSPAAASDSASAIEDGTVVGDVRSNDSDPDATNVTFVSAIAYGATAGAVGTPVPGLYGSLTLNATGTYSYTANADYLDTLRGVTGLQDVFSYTISDGHGGTSTATLTVNVSLASDERTINGTVAADVIYGDQNGLTGAEDTIFGGKGADQLFGNDGSDTLWGGAGDDRLSGGQSRDTLFGEDGNDTLDGGVGDDRLAGGGGNDRLTGGTGADTFVFAKSGGADTITDFQSGMDYIQLDGVTVKSSTFTDIDHNGTLDLILQLSSGSVTLLNVSTPLPASTFVTTNSSGHLPMEILALHPDAISLFV